MEGLGDAQQRQAPLWQALVSYRRAGAAAVARANLLYQRFISTLEKRTNRPTGLAVARFHLRDLARCRQFIGRLQALGKHVDVYVLFTNPCTLLLGVKDPAFRRAAGIASGAITVRRALPLFATHRAGAGLSNADAGEQDVGNPLNPPKGKLGRAIYLLAGWSATQEWTHFCRTARITCCVTCSRISLNTPRGGGRAEQRGIRPQFATNVLR